MFGYRQDARLVSGGNESIKKRSPSSPSLVTRGGLRFDRRFFRLRPPLPRVSWLAMVAPRPPSRESRLSSTRDSLQAKGSSHVGGRSCFWLGLFGPLLCLRLRG